jgi:uridine monophosphate synthetase
MIKNNLISALYQIGAIQLGEFTLKSGQTSSVYINLRKIISYPDLLRQIASAVWHSVEGRGFDLICGVPYTALPIATCLSLDHQLPMVLRRKEKKEYGTKQIIEGVFEPGQRCLVIEDVITTGSSLAETIADLEQAGLVVHDLAAVLDREQSGKAHLGQQYRVHTVLSLSEVLHALLHADFLPAAERILIEKFLMEKAAK